MKSAKLLNPAATFAILQLGEFIVNNPGLEEVLIGGTYYPGDTVVPQTRQWSGFEGYAGEYLRCWLLEEHQLNRGPMWDIAVRLFQICNQGGYPEEMHRELDEADSR